jgi:hypothetical protein
MNYLPKSLPGAVIAGLYLVLVGCLILVFVFGGGGLHGDAAMAFIFAWMLTLPLSSIVMALTLSTNDTQTSSLDYFLIVAGLAVCALINTAVIYLLVYLVSRGLRALFKKPLK